MYLRPMRVDVTGIVVDHVLEQWRALEVRPEAVLVAAAVATVLLVVTMLIFRPRKAPARVRPASPRHAEVRALAAKGASPALIARRTGLAHDAVVTIIRATGTQAVIPARNSRPGAAPFAALRGRR
jgi:type II secretory pathway component PulM